VGVSERLAQRCPRLAGRGSREAISYALKVHNATVGEGAPHEQRPFCDMVTAPLLDGTSLDLKARVRSASRRMIANRVTELREVSPRLNQIHIGSERTSLTFRQVPRNSRALFRRQVGDRHS